MANTPTQPTPTSGPSTLFDVLAHPDRRRILGLLADRSTCTMTVLARELAAAGQPTAADETERPAETDRDPPEAAVERYRTFLHHVHLPKLAEANLVSYDPDDVVVSLVASDERLDRIDALLAVTER